MTERNYTLDCLDTKTPRAEDYNICTEKDSPNVNQQTNEDLTNTRADQVSLNVIEHTADNLANDHTPEDNIEHNRTPVTERGNEGHSEDSVLSSGGGSCERGVIPEPGSPEEPLAVSSPVVSARDHDSGVYTAEDLFRDMLAKRGKGQL